jgi:hypothetical protein
VPPPPHPFQASRNACNRQRLLEKGGHAHWPLPRRFERRRQPFLMTRAEGRIDVVRVVFSFSASISFFCLLVVLIDQSESIDSIHILSDDLLVPRRDLTCYRLKTTLACWNRHPFPLVPVVRFHLHYHHLLLPVGLV